MLAVVGLKPTVSVEEPPGAMDIGVAIPDIVNELPAIVALEIVRFALPIFLIVTDCVFVTPTDTLGKLMLEGITEILDSTPAPLSAMVALDKAEFPTM